MNAEPRDDRGLGAREHPRPLARPRGRVDGLAAVARRVPLDLRRAGELQARGLGVAVAAWIAAVREDASPRHVPDQLVPVAEIPRTLTGKILEVPVKKLLMGRDPATVVSRDALANPVAFDWFVEYAAANSIPS